MSKISLEPNTSGAGTFTLAAPNSNTNRTLNLPDASGNIIAADASTGQFDSSNMPAGSVLQVQSTTKIDTAITTSETFVDLPGMSVDITPFFSTSKILIIADCMGGGNANRHTVDFRFRRDNNTIGVSNTSVVTPCSFGFIVHNSSTTPAGASGSHLDTPSTTSPTTYSLQWRCGNIGDTAVTEAYLNRVRAEQSSLDFPRYVSTITVMEIAA